MGVCRVAVLVLALTGCHKLFDLTEVSPEGPGTGSDAALGPCFEEHFMAANATDLVTKVTTAEMTGNDTAMVGGDYYLSARGGQKISGHFFQVLKRDTGT